MSGNRISACNDRLLDMSHFPICSTFPCLSLSPCSSSIIFQPTHLCLRQHSESCPFSVPILRSESILQNILHKIWISQHPIQHLRKGGKNRHTVLWAIILFLFYIKKTNLFQTSQCLYTFIAFLYFLEVPEKIYLYYAKQLVLRKEGAAEISIDADASFWREQLLGDFMLMSLFG